MSEVDKNNAPAQDSADNNGDANTSDADNSSDAAKGDDKNDTNTTSSSTEEMVSIKKSDWEAMTSRQSAIDKKEERLKRREKRLAKKSNFNKPDNQANDDDDDSSDFGSAEDRKAYTGLISLALKPEYREVLDANPTLRDTLARNPLSLLPVYASDAADADDAIDLMMEHLDSLKDNLPKKDAQPQPAPADEKKKEEIPPAGAVNASSIYGNEIGKEGMNDKAYKDRLEQPTTKNIADAIKYRFTRSVK